jgi:hypothetical protein
MQNHTGDNAIHISAATTLKLQCAATLPSILICAWSEQYVGLRIAAVPVAVIDQPSRMESTARSSLSH